MATERVTTRDEPDGGGATYVDRGGSHVVAIIIGVAILALVAIGAFFMLTAHSNEAIQTGAVTSAASSVAGSVNPK